MKRIIIIAAAIMLLTSFKKDMSSDTSNQADLALKKYADIASHALLSYTYKGTAVQITAPQGINGPATRPLKDSGSGTVSYIPNVCGDGTLQVMAVGTGRSTSLGLLTQVTTFCMNGSTGEIISPIEGVGTAANGDKLFYTFVGAGIDSEKGLPYQDYIFTGGTGRFTNATGSMTLMYQVNTPTNYSYTGEGTITY